MKRIFSTLCFFALILCAKAGEPTNDYLYATGLQYDEEIELYYFDVVLEGENYYAAYGIDVQLPAGIIVEDADYILRVDDIYPYSGKLKKEYSHSVMANFPSPDDHSHLRVGCLSTKEEKLTATNGTLFRVYVTIDYQDNNWPIGTIKCYDVELTIDKDHYYDAPVTETIVPIHTGTTTLPLKVSTVAKWSTCILPFSCSIPEGVKAYTCANSDEEYVYLDPVETFAAYTPYILYAENGFDSNVSGTVEAAGYPETGVVTSGYLRGAIVPQTATEGYVLQNHDGDVKFYAIQGGDSFVIPAGKCWMNIPGNQSNALRFRSSEEADGINSVTVSAPALSYDLNGRMLHQGKGISIKNGKKTISL